MSSFVCRFFTSLSYHEIHPEYQIRCVKWNLNQHGLCNFFTKSYIWPLVRIVSMRRFSQVVKHRIWWRNGHNRNKNTLLIWSPLKLRNQIWLPSTKLSMCSSRDLIFYLPLTYLLHLIWELVQLSTSAANISNSS